MEDASTKETIPRCEAAAPAEKPSSWLLAKEIPYAMTVIVTALGWCVVHVIGAIEESPSVGYGKKIKPINKDSFEVTFRVTNITRSHFFAASVSMSLPRTGVGLTKRLFPNHQQKSSKMTIFHHNQRSRIKTAKRA